jgi:hypothetical protein
VQILFLEPEANTGVMCTVIAEKEVGTAMQLFSNTVSFLLLSQSGASRWYVELYSSECKHCCFLHPFEQHIDLNSSLKILTVQCCNLPYEL